MRRLKLIATAAAALLVPLTVGTTAQSAYSEFYYQYYFYSDATKTDVVGHYREYCLNNYYIITPLVTGTVTEHYRREAIGVCPGLGDW